MSEQEHKGIIAWFAHNPVAANLLMAFIMIVGLGSAFTIQRAIFPSLDIEIVFVTVAYPGAAPEEVEKGVVMRIEEAIKDVDGIERVESDAFESHARIMVEPLAGVDLGKLTDDIRNRIDGIQHFPDGVEKAIVTQPELRFPALSIQVSGALDERSMKSLADEMRRELVANPKISAAEVVGAREFEIAIEVPEARLREYHLTLEEVAQRIASSSLDLPGGSVRADSGDIMLRTVGQAYVQQDFESIVLRTFPDGTRLLLSDIASVNDGFVDGSGFASFDAKYSLGINVYASGDQDVVETADAAKAYVEEKRASVAEGIDLDVWLDLTYYLNDRLGMMMRNLAMGALLVFIILALFLEIKLAFWVMLGIPVCFLGAMAIINTPYIDASLNMISIFGFILVLGIVVDDAIIMGESAYSEVEKKGHSVSNVVNGVYRVSTPATFGVLTTIVAFSPTLFIEGPISAFPEACGWVVILCLVFSLVESKWILPAHLAHTKPTRNKFLLKIDHVQEGANDVLRYFVDYRYIPFVKRCVRNRYLTLAVFLSVLILSGGLLLGGVVRTIVAPDVPGEFIQAEIRMVQGTPEERTLEAVKKMVATLFEVQADYQRESGADDPLVKHVGAYGFERINGMITVELTKEDQRGIATTEISRRWREALGTIHSAEIVSINNADGPKFGPAIAFDLKHNNFDVLRAASSELQEIMHHYDGLYDIRNGASDTADEFHLDILPEAESLGLTRFDLGNQVRHAFYGAEAQRIQRGFDEIKVMVRYPLADRESVGSLNDMYIRTPQGDEVPIASVASVDTRQGLLKATRINFQRAAEVTAEVDKSRTEPRRVMDNIENEVLPELIKKYPGLSYAISGLASEEAAAVKSMIVGFSLAILGIYALLAIPTRSYLQPLIIMGVIPFGIIGAVVGHWLLGLPMSMMSMMGVIALSGVVVNDSLILVDYVNKLVAKGESTINAVMEAGTRRFRAILLTSLTTFFGLAPMLLERSAQAQEILPMAVSLAFGIVFATVITLLLVPCLYMILDDLRRWSGGHWRQPEGRVDALADSADLPPGGAA
ncbi:MAG: efflux RND transporter permease subunit [Halieaceae bacterium]